MKARFLALAALVLGLASCQTDPEVVNPVVDAEVDFQLAVAAPELATRAGENGAADTQNAYDSAFGAIDYLQTTTEADAYRVDWKEVDLRYTLEVYDVKDGAVVGTAPVKDRQVIIKDSYEPVVFDLRLVPNRDYRFVVFADFVAQGGAALDATAQLGVAGIRHKIGATLADIEVINESINDEVGDAYFATKDIKVTNSAAQDIVLKRPYGKVRVIATDLAELNLNVHPYTVEIAYDAYNCNKFDAVTGVIKGQSATAKYTTTFINKVRDNMDKHVYNVGYDAKTAPAVNGTVRNTHITLATDYILALPEGQTPIHFTMVVKDEAGVVIKETAFTTDIPVERNKLTTVIGNVLTTATEIEVRIDDNFAGENVQSSWDGKAKEPKKDAEGNWLISEASELAWLADQVNGTTRAAGRTFEGETFKLTKDVDLNNDRWTPIGATGKFLGTFDGQNHKVTNLFVSETDKTPVGLFSNARNVKNVKVIGAEIYGHYKAGVIVGDGLCARIENCHVENAIVKIVPLNKDDANHAGGIVGYLSGEPVAYVKGSSVKNAEITAFRDVAGIAGCANSAAEVTGNTVENVTVTADQTAEYVSNEKDGNAAAVAGRLSNKAVVKDNNVADDVVVIRKVDSTKEFEAALKDRRNEDVIYVGEGEVVLPASLAVSGIDKLTIEGLDAKAAVQFNSKPGGADGGLNCYADGTELIFKNIKVVSPNTGSSYTGGFGRAKSVLFDNCYYEGQYRSLSYVKFNKCTIDPKTSYIYTDYSDADFVECTFNCSEGKGIQVYNDGNTTNTTINVTDCTFTAAKQGQTWDKKPVTAIDINSNGEKFTVNINDTTATGFPEGEFTGETLFNIKGGAEHVTIKINGNTWVGKGIITDDEGNLVVNSILSLETALKSAGAAGAGDTTIVFAENTNINMTNAEWTPIKVDGYHGADIVTIEGNGAVITGLKAPLFAGGFAGGSGIVIKNLTIKDSDIVSANTLGSGAFIESVDSMAKIELTNCHLLDSTVTGGAGSRTGGLIGWTAGYNNVNDGPVKTYVTIDNCSVVGCTIQCDGSVGGINGHAGNNAWTYTTISNCTIKNNNLNSTDDGEWRTGVVVGTANVGEVTINNITESGNTLTQTGKTAPEGYLRNYYGRAVLGTTGKLTIEGNEYIAEGLLKNEDGDQIAYSEAGLKEALDNGGTVVLANPFTIDQSESNGYGKTGINMTNGGTLDGNGNELGAPGSTGTWDSAINTSGGTIKNIKVTKGFRGIFIKKDNNHNEKLYLDNVTINGTTYTISCDSGNGLGLEATNSTFKGWTSYAGTLGNAKFTDCYFGYGNGYSYCRPYAPTEFVGCEFEAGLTLDPRADVTFENCTIDGVALTTDNLATLVTNTAKATIK